jgi:branched-chain amino acid transport system substrate-binding protein
MMHLSISSTAPRGGTRAAALPRWRALLASLLLALSAAPAAAEVAVTDKNITVGGSFSLTGPLAAIGNDYTSGMNAVLDEVNGKGGVHGRKIEFLQLDDGYDPKRTAENSSKLLDQGVFAFLGTLGTANIAATMPMVEERKVPFFAAFSGADSLRAMKQRYMFTVVASYGDEAEKMVQHAHTMGMNLFSVAYLDNPFGKDGLAGVERALQKRRLSPTVTAAVKTDASNAEEAARTIASSPAQIVLVMTAGEASTEFVRHLRRFSPAKQIMLLSVADTNLLVRELGKAAEGIVVAQTVPAPLQSKLRVSREYQEAMKRAGKEAHVGYASMTGYLSARAFVEILHRTGPNPTREGFLKAAHIGPVDLGGFILDYTENRQHGSKYVELTIIRAGGKMFQY